MYNIKIRDINPTARYNVTMTAYDDSADVETKTMDGETLIAMINGCAHLYDIDAELIPADPTTETETAEQTTETTQDEQRDARIIELMQKSIDCISPRSAWGHGVKLYACELLGSLAECVEWAHKNGEPSPLESRETVRAALLNGAEDWSQYSWGSCSLIYNGDIAERLCSPSELKRKRGGALPPNAAEDWLDVQARALRRAAQYVIGTYDLAANGQYLIREGARA